jgi:hypothetical protein
MQKRSKFLKTYSFFCNKKKRRVFRLAVISAVRIARKLTSFALFCSDYMIPLVCDDFVMKCFNFGYNVKPVWLNFYHFPLQS